MRRQLIGSMPTVAGRGDANVVFGVGNRGAAAAAPVGAEPKRGRDNRRRSSLSDGDGTPSKRGNKKKGQLQFPVSGHLKGVHKSPDARKRKKEQFVNPQQWRMNGKPGARPPVLVPPEAVSPEKAMKRTGVGKHRANKGAAAQKAAEFKKKHEAALHRVQQMQAAADQRTAEVQQTREHQTQARLQFLQSRMQFGRHQNMDTVLSDPALVQKAHYLAESKRVEDLAALKFSERMECSLVY